MKVFVTKTDTLQKNQTMLYSQRFVDINRLVSDTKIELIEKMAINRTEMENDVNNNIKKLTDLVEQ